MSCEILSTVHNFIVIEHEILSPAKIKCQLLIGQWPVHTKPMHPTCSYVTSQGVFALLYMWNSKMFCIPHGDERMKFLRKKRKTKKNILISTKTTTMQYIILLDFLLYWWLCLLCSVTFVDSHYETLIFMLFTLVSS